MAPIMSHMTSSAAPIRITASDCYVFLWFHVTHSASRLEPVDLVLEQRGGNRRLARLAAQERLGELLRLLVLHFPWQRRLVRIDVHIHERWPGVAEGLLDGRAHVGGPLDLEAE